MCGLGSQTTGLMPWAMIRSTRRRNAPVPGLRASRATRRTVRWLWETTTRSDQSRGESQGTSPGTTGMKSMLRSNCLMTRWMGRPRARAVASDSGDGLFIGCGSPCDATGHRRLDAVRRAFLSTRTGSMLTDLEWWMMVHQGGTASASDVRVGGEFAPFASARTCRGGKVDLRIDRPLISGWNRFPDVVPPDLPADLMRPRAINAVADRIQRM